MKTNIFLFGLFVFFFSNCTSPRYLPTSDKIDVNEYGSYINVVCKTHYSIYSIYGELIAIDSNKIIVLQNYTKKCVTVPLSDVKRFDLKYAKPKNYVWTIPVNAVGDLVLSTLTGDFLPIPPVNIILTIWLSKSGFKYSNKDITYDELKMFARFPQGIPPNIDLNSIHQPNLQERNAN